MCTHSTAHIQVYKKMRVALCASRNFKDNLRVGLMRHKKHSACEQLIADELKLLVSESCHACNTHE